MNSDKVLRIIFVRHGQTKSNLEKRLQYLEDPLTDKGKEQAKNLKEVLKKYVIDEIICSDEKRAIETAKIINNELDLEVDKIPLIREKSSGDFSKKLVSEVDWSIVTGDFLNKKIPGGESVLDVIKRSLDFIKVLNNKKRGKNILVVSHGTFLRILYSIMFNKSPKDLLLNCEFPNAMPIIVSMDDGGKWHLEESSIKRKND